ncbi:hypothetical protein C8J57DRAFT_1567511 [Mycena rebaudengoi]|nr:hypothetical protein C8J57DRAFT_1567511 [Mycena rebaudengoi]
MACISHRPVFHLLPHDILHQIFMICVEEASNQSFPVVLSQVCRSWRSSAFDGAAIWTKISFQLRRDGEPQKYLQAKAFLHRSRTMPVAVRIYAHRVLQRADIDAVSRDILAAMANRITGLALVAPEEQMSAPLYVLMRNNWTPSLRFFQLVIPGFSHFQFHREPSVDYYLMSPSLRNLQNQLDRRAPPLTALTLHNDGTMLISLASLRSLLVCCQSTLQQLDIQGMRPGSDTPANLPVALSVLTYLRLGYYNDMSSLAENLVTPHLHTLILHNMPSDLSLPSPRIFYNLRPIDVEPLLHSLRRNCGNLLQLSLIGVRRCRRAAVDTFYRSLPKLRSLYISPITSKFFEDALFQPEARFRTPEIIFPALTSLGVPPTEPTDLARFLLRHRVLPVLPLKNLCITVEQLRITHSQPQRSILSLIVEINLNDNGLQVSTAPTPIIHPSWRKYTEIPRAANP